MNSPTCQAKQGIAWPQNGAYWIEQQMLFGPGDIDAQFAVVDRSQTESAEEVEWRITLGTDSVKLERHEGAVAHLPREFAYEDFSDVVLWGALAHTDDADVMVGLSLYSAKHELQIPVCIQSDVSGLAEYWTAWSRALGVAPKVLDNGECLRDPFQGLGGLLQQSSHPRRLPSQRLDRGAWMPSSSWRPDAQASVGHN
jgi:hypothetical protein